MKSIQAQYPAALSSQVVSAMPVRGNAYAPVRSKQLLRKSVAFFVGVLVAASANAQSSSPVEGAPIVTSGSSIVVPTSGQPVVTPGAPIVVPSNPINIQQTPPPRTIQGDFTILPFEVTSDNTNGIVIRLFEAGSYLAPTASIFLPTEAGYLDPKTGAAMGCTAQTGTSGGEQGQTITCPLINKIWQKAACPVSVAGLFCLLSPPSTYSTFSFTAGNNPTTGAFQSMQATVSFPVYLNDTPENTAGNVSNDSLNVTLATGDGSVSQTFTTNYLLALTVLNAKQLGWFKDEKQVKVQTTPAYCQNSGNKPNMATLFTDCHESKWITMAESIAVGAAVMIVAPFAPIAATADLGAVAGEAAEEFNSVATVISEQTIEAGEPALSPALVE